MQFIFVNGRPVQNKAIGFHLNQVYRLIMPKDLYPLFVVSLQLPAKEIDVNIHPAKREVKIKDEQRICAALRQLCEQTLMQSGHMKQGSGYRAAGDVAGRALMGTHTSGVTFDSALGTKIFEATAARDYAYPNAPEKQNFFIPEMTRQENLQSKLSGAVYIGALLNKYQLFQTSNADLRSLLVVDQHAAAERVTYERLIRQMNKGTVEVQRLLSPVLIKLSIQEMLVWEKSRDELTAFGLESTLWDKETLGIHSYPAFLKDIEKAARYILGGEEITRGDHDALARRACRSSVMAGDVLKSQQAEHLRDELLQCLDPFTCPHGRPTVVEMSEEFLDKQFLRVK
jgi:DNA mismatch repair protein MutL